MTKYGNRITERDGFTFDSKAEADDWTQLQLRERAGQIHNLRRQVPFELQPAYRLGKKIVRPITHVVDFVYNEGDLLIAHDTKGIETAVWKLKRKMFEYQFPLITYRVSKVESRRTRR